MVKNPAQPKVSSESYLGLGLIIGLIIAIVIAVIAYSLGKKKRGVPDGPMSRQTAARPTRDMPDDDGQSTDEPRSAPSRPVRPSRPTSPPAKEEPSAPVEEHVEPGPLRKATRPDLMSEGPATAPAGAEVAATTQDEDTSMGLTPTVEESFAPVKDEPELTPEQSKDAPNTEEASVDEKPQPGPPMDDTTSEAKGDDTQVRTDTALTEILKKLEK